MIIEKKSDFPEQLLGNLGSILYHSNKALNDEQLTIDIQFEKSNISIMNNKEAKASICALNKKK